MGSYKTLDNCARHNYSHDDSRNYSTETFAISRSPALGSMSLTVGNRREELEKNCNALGVWSGRLAGRVKKYNPPDQHGQRDGY